MGERWVLESMALGRQHRQEQQHKKACTATGLPRHGRPGQISAAWAPRTLLPGWKVQEPQADVHSGRRKKDQEARPS